MSIHRKKSRIVAHLSAILAHAPQKQQPSRGENSRSLTSESRSHFSLASEVRVNLWMTGVFIARERKIRKSVQFSCVSFESRCREESKQKESMGLSHIQFEHFHFQNILRRIERPLACRREIFAVPDNACRLGFQTKDANFS